MSNIDKVKDWRKFEAEKNCQSNRVRTKVNSQH